MQIRMQRSEQYGVGDWIAPTIQASCSNLFHKAHLSGVDDYRQGNGLDITGSNQVIDNFDQFAPFDVVVAIIS